MSPYEILLNIIIPIEALVMIVVIGSVVHSDVKYHMEQKKKKRRAIYYARRDPFSYELYKRFGRLPEGA